MAEVVGLVLGALSIVSLFTTCVDLFDRVELGLRHEAGSQLAVDKIGLLRLRLANWGAVLGVGETSPALDGHPSHQHGVVARSLVHIRTNLESALKLGEKHQAKSKSSSSSNCVEPPTRHPHQKSALDLTVWRRSIHLRKRTQWALHDKQKFDGLIQDLSFLIENLEKVTVSDMSSSKTIVSFSDLKSKSALAGKQKDIPRDILIERNDGALATHSCSSGTQHKVSRVEVDPSSFANVHQNEQINEDGFGVIGDTVEGKSGMAVRNLYMCKQKNSKKAIGIIGPVSDDIVQRWLSSGT